jgi:hypothetical protein
MDSEGEALGGAERMGLWLLMLPRRWEARGSGACMLGGVCMFALTWAEAWAWAWECVELVDRKSPRSGMWVGVWDELEPAELRSGVRTWHPVRDDGVGLYMDARGDAKIEDVRRVREPTDAETEAEAGLAGEYEGNEAWLNDISVKSDGGYGVSETESLRCSSWATDSAARAERGATAARVQSRARAGISRRVGR